ncbi:MAG: YkgJ family cysteine cluster protein [Deltaproteobacteria bacterium]|nr:YkgJ family cysteine cluster protein [Deltaproteobacteria bacterium]
MLSTENFFECKECGECCKGYGGTSVSEKKIEEAAAFINIGIRQFIDKYCVNMGNGYALAQKKDGFCIFFKNKLCLIHSVKPKMCKDWPFIKNVVKRPETWLVIAQTCPGINKNASLKQVAEYILKRQS